MSPYPPEIKDAAKRLYLRRHKPKEIADIANVPLRTVYDWRNKEGWDDLLSHETVEGAMARRLALLAEKEEKAPIDLEEIKSLTDSLVRLRAGGTGIILGKGNHPEERRTGGRDPGKSQTPGSGKTMSPG